MRIVRRPRRPNPGARLLALVQQLRTELATLLGDRSSRPGGSAPVVDPYRPSRRAYRQAVRRPDYAAYTLTFVLVIIVLGAALLLGLSWAFGGGAGGLAGQLFDRATPGPVALATATPVSRALPPGQPAAVPTAPAGGATPGVLPTLPPLSPTPVPQPTPAPRRHKVEAGDTLFGLARRYGTTIEAIMAANGFTDRNRTLRVGEELVIPPPSPTPTPGSR